MLVDMISMLNMQTDFICLTKEKLEVNYFAKILIYQTNSLDDVLKKKPQCYICLKSNKKD